MQATGFKHFIFCGLRKFSAGLLVFVSSCGTYRSCGHIAFCAICRHHHTKMDTEADKKTGAGPKDHDSFDESDVSVEVIPSFDEMPLHTNLLRGIYSYGFEKPSAIQQRAIVPFIKGGDIIAQAQSGTGATASISPLCHLRVFL